MKTNRRE